MVLSGEQYPLLQQGLPINVIELVDINKDQRLLISDKTLSNLLGTEKVVCLIPELMRKLT